MAEKKYSLIEMLKSDKVYAIPVTAKQYADLQNRVHKIRALNDECNGKYYVVSHLWIVGVKDYEYLIILAGANSSLINEYTLRYDATIKYSEIDLVMKPRKKEK